MYIYWEYYVPGDGIIKCGQNVSLRNSHFMKRQMVKNYYCSKFSEKIFLHALEVPNAPSNL